MKRASRPRERNESAMPHPLERPRLRPGLAAARDESDPFAVILFDQLRLSRQPVKKQAVAPAALVRQCLAELVPERDGRRVEITIRDLPTCEADPALCRPGLPIAWQVRSQFCSWIVQ